MQILTAAEAELSTPIEHLKDRFRHPFLGTFSVAFLVYNWQAVLYATTGTAEADVRIANIVITTWGKADARNSDFIFHPFYAAVFLSLILPVATSLLNVLYHYYKVIENNFRDKISDEFANSSALKFRQTRDISRHLIAKAVEFKKPIQTGIQPKPDAIVNVLSEIITGLNVVATDQGKQIKSYWSNVDRKFKTRD